MQVVHLNPENSSDSDSERGDGQDGGGGVMVSFVNGQVIKEKVPRLNSGPLFDYLLKVSNGNPAVDIEKVKQYIAESPVDFVNPIFGNYTALFLVAQSRHLTEEVLDLLLDAGYNKEAVDSWGKTPLFEALMNNNIAFAKRLIERGANVNHAAPSGNALCFAVRSNNIELIQMLLEKGVDINFVSQNGDMVLNEAISNNNMEIAKYLLTQTIQPIALNSTPEKPLFNPPLCAAVSSDKLEYVDLLLEAGADVNNYGEEKLTPLILALWRRELEIVKRLFEKGAKPSELPMDELFIAARNKVPDAIEKLVELGADIKKSYKGRSLVSFAMGAPHIDKGNSERLSWEQQERNQMKYQEALNAIGDTVKVLGKFGLDFNKGSDDDPHFVPLLQAQNVEVFKLVESFGASLTVDLGGSTLLHAMMDVAMTDILEYVLQKGVIDINAKNSEGLTALHLACKLLEAPDEYSEAENLTPNVELLVKYKADVNVLNNDNQTPLMFALAHKNLDAARVLVRNGANLDVKDKNGNNLVHTACSLPGAGENLLALLTKCADVELLKKWLNEKNTAGETPVEVAKNSGNESIALLLNGDLLGAASKGVLIFDFAKLQPEAIQKLERGYECHEADTSKYDLNTGQASLFFKLAKEVVPSILEHVNVEDLVSFAMACRQFKQWADMSHIWKSHFKREYGIEPKTASPKKELAVKWHTQVNMRKGAFLSRVLSLTPEVETPKEIEGYANYHHVGVESMDFDSESGQLFVGDLKSSITVVDVKNALIKKTIKMTKGEEHDGHQVNGVTFVPKDNTLLYHKGSGCLMARNLETDQERQIAASCRDLSVSGDFAMTANYQTNALYNWKTGENVWSFSEGKSSYTVLLQDNIAVTGTGANGDTKVRFWDITTKAKIAESEGQGYATYLTRGKKYAVGTASQLIECFEIATGKSLWRHKKAHSGVSISHVAINEESMMVASVSNSELIVWDLLTGKKLAELSEQEEDSKNGWSPMARQYLSLCTKGHLIFAGVLDTKSGVEVWDSRRPQAPLYVVPLTAGPKCMIVQDNYVLAGLMNDSVKIINFNV